MSQLGVTPTGNPPVQPAHIPWLTDAQYINYPTGTGITSSSTLYTTGTLTNMCAMACEYIENYCGRYFSSQTGID
ncbi:MAG TPA: hypothetical protein VNG53_11160, partial [Bacteroidia bacterium]|nr:hypothetical protein [Bacteroidia bacterium]